MHRLVADLPALFRRGVVPEGFAPALDTGDLPRPVQQLTEVCAEGIQSLEPLLSHLETGKRIHAATSRTPGPVASPSGLESPWQHFLRAVPDRDLELSSVWAHAAAHLQGLEMDPEQRETQLKDLALLALWRRSCLVHRFLVDRLSNCACFNADLAILRPSMKAEIQMFKGLLTAISAGSVGACAVAATAQATRDAAQQRRSAAAAAATALVQRHWCSAGARRRRRRCRGGRRWSRQTVPLKASNVGCTACVRRPVWQPVGRTLTGNDRRRCSVPA